jgi:uncharacterized protein (DUF433 family)
MGKRPPKSVLKHFPLGAGAYTVPESTRVIRQRILHELGKQPHVSGRALQRWSHGRIESTKRYAPIIRGTAKVARDTIFTFTELIELLTIAMLWSCGVSPHRIREAYEAASEKYGDHPFARETYRTDGIGVFTKYNDPEPEELVTHQTFSENVLRAILKDVSYLDGTAARFSPLGESRLVVLDPTIAFGAPVEKRTGVPTSTLDLMAASGEPIEAIADWYGVTVAGVRDAIEYEEELRKAA